jgi:small subunit ribosomal protein S2
MTDQATIDRLERALVLTEMFEAGVHFGHQARTWNPKMAPYIFGEREGIHILDVIQTAVHLELICQYLRDSVKRGEHVLLVGTRGQAAGPVRKAVTQCLHEGPQQVHYVNHRWLGGMLTNWSTIQICIQKLQRLDTQEKNGFLATMPKKEAAAAKKQYARLRKFLGGVQEMPKVPETVLIIGQPTEVNAVQECQKLKLRTITFLDTDCDPSLTDLFLPANDDSVASIELLITKMVDAIREGQALAR